MKKTLLTIENKIRQLRFFGLIEVLINRYVVGKSGVWRVVCLCVWWGERGKSMHKEDNAVYGWTTSRDELKETYDWIVKLQDRECWRQPTFNAEMRLDIDDDDDDVYF